VIQKHKENLLCLCITLDCKFCCEKLSSRRILNPQNRHAYAWIIPNSEIPHPLSPLLRHVSVAADCCIVCLCVVHNSGCSIADSEFVLLISIRSSINGVTRNSGGPGHNIQAGSSPFLPLSFPLPFPLRDFPPVIFVLVH